MLKILKGEDKELNEKKGLYQKEVLRQSKSNFDLINQK